MKAAALHAEDSLMTLVLVRAYSIPTRDERASKLITWYVKTIQKVIDYDLEYNIEWGR